MVVVAFEEVTCRGLAETNDKYRLVLFASENRKGELRSAYRPATDVFGWKSPFKNSVVFQGSTAPLHVIIRLREKGWPGMAGRNVCSYTLNFDRNHASRTFELDATESSIQPSPRLAVTVSVAGLATNDVEPVTQADQHAIDAPPPVDSRSFEQNLSASFQNSPIVEPPPHPASIESPTAYPPSLAHPATVPALQVIAPDDTEHKTSSSPDGLDRILHDQTRGLSRPAPRPTASHVDSAQLLSAESAARKAKNEQSTIRQRSNSITDSISTVEPVGSAAGGLGDAMYSGVSRLEAVVQVINVAADIHPLVKGVWSLLNVAYTLARQQSDLDLKVGDLVDALDANCELARVLTEDQIAGVAETIVAKILREVLNGAEVIKEYCIVRKSKMSAFKFAGSTTAIRIDACLQTLEVFRRNLADHVAANVHHDLHTLASTLEVELRAVKAQMDQVSKYVQTQEDDALLNQMPFAPEADRAMRSDERGCLPGTRGEIIEAIVHWAIGADVGPSQAYIRGLNTNSRVLWLCGVAGSGKSSIAISVAKVLRSMGRLGAIYGFETAFQTSLNPTTLFSTIARQRADQQPGRKRYLLTTLNSMNRDQRATVSASEQFKSFLSAPVTEDPTILDDVVVIDAFDESGPVSKRAAALLALSPEVRTSTFPSDVRFIITSRYDPDVAKRLESVCVGDQSIASVLQMEDIYPPHTERDIELYVVHMLRDTDGLDAARAAGDLVRLAMTAEHSFQWASVSCRYIADADDHDGAHLPSVRLDEALATRGGLDDMYLSILNRSFGDGVSKESDGTRSLAMILGCLVCAEEPVSVHIIAALASADPSTRTVDEPNFHLLARKLSSIITGTKNTTTPLVAFHTSFTDFLATDARSQRYAVHPPVVHLHLALASLATMKKLLRFNMCHFPTSFLRNDQVPDLAHRVKENISSELSYACRFWPSHVAAALATASAETGLLRASFSGFLKDKLLLLQWLEVMSLTGTHAYESLSPLLSLQADNRDLSDLLLFITYFSVPIRTSVPHIYLSTLAFAPTCSLIIAPVSAHFPKIVRSDHPLLSWPQVRHSLKHQSEVNSVVFSPNGQWVVSGAKSGEISVWDVYSGSPILPRMSVSGLIMSIAISRDGSLLASGSRDRTIQLWNMRTLSAVGEPVKAHTNWVRSVIFSPDGRLLASGSDDCTIRLWDLQSGLAVQRASATHDNFVLSVAFSPDGKLLASGSSDGTVRLWDVPTLSPVGEPLRGHTDWVLSLVFSLNGTLLVSGSADKTIRFWDVNAQSAVGEPLTAHDSHINSVAFSPNGQTLASCSADKTIRLWDAGSRSPLGEPLTGHTGIVRSIAFSPDGSLLASGSFDKTVHIWDARVLAQNRESSTTQFKFQDFATFSRDGELLASGSDENMIQLWDVHSMSPVGEPLRGHTNSVRSVTFSPDGTLLASGSDDETVRLWDVSTGSAVGEPLGGHSHSVLALAFSPDNKLLASASWDSTIRLWDTHAHSASGDPLTGHSMHVLSVAFSPDGSTLASGDAGGTIRLWDVQTRSLIGQVLEGHSDVVRCVAFSPGGTLLASGLDNKTVRLWDVHTQSAVGEPLKGHTNYVYSLTFSHDGALLASSFRSEGVVQIWDVRAPSEVGAPVALLRHESNVFSIAFPSASPLLSSITSDGVVREWDLGYLLSATSSTLPQNPEERLKQHKASRFSGHPDLTALSPDFLVNLDDGWVIGPNKELVLWIPPALRPSIDDVRVNAHFGAPRVVKLDFSDFVCGSDWTKCYSPPPPSSTS